MDTLSLKNPVPAQVVNEQASFGPFKLKKYVHVPEDSGPLHFTAGLLDGSPLPKGLICTSEGVLTGIPSKGTQGNYQVVIEVKNETSSLHFEFSFTIKPSFIEAGSPEIYLDKLKAQVWSALAQNLPIPDLKELLDRSVSVVEIYYLLERWGTLTIWNAFDLDPPGVKQLLTLEGASEHYFVYDRGSCLIAVPTDLFSSERTVEDGLRTARAMAREIYMRNWTVELVGFSKFTRAAWVEMRHLGDITGKYLEVINFAPTTHDVKVYQALAPQL